jgi:hypothetical protein
VLGATAVTAVDDTAITTENVAVRIKVLDNDTTEPSGETKYLQYIENPPHGSATFAGAGNSEVEYTPDQGYCGEDNFAYTVSADGPVFDNGAVKVTIVCSPSAVPSAAPSKVPSAAPTADSQTVWTVFQNILYSIFIYPFVWFFELLGIA